MRVLLVLFVSAGTALAHASDTMRVDGVLVYGRVHEVSIGAIREAIADFKSTSSHNHAPAAIQVLSDREMRAYLPGRDMGWMAIHSIPRGDPGHRNEPAWTTWGRAIEDVPEVCRFMRDANEVSVFPVILPVERDKKLGMLVGLPQRDNKRMRLLGADARRELVYLVGHERHWFHGFDDRIWMGDVPANVGFVFRRATDELVLYFTLGSKAECIMPNREHLAGSLEEKPGEKLEQWKKRYGQPELATK